MGLSRILTVQAICVPSCMGIPFSYYIPEWLGLWLGLGCRAHIPRVLGMGIPKTQESPYHCDTALEKKWFYYFSRLRFDKDSTLLRVREGILTDLPKALTRSWKLYTVSSFGHSFVPVDQFGSEDLQALIDDRNEENCNTRANQHWNGENMKLTIY